MDKLILDATCGSRTMWFDKHHPAVIYCDKRQETFERVWRGSERPCVVAPDVICDFTHLPFDDKTFRLVVFDPPHLERVGETSWTFKKYGKLEEGWEDTLRSGFHECLRVLKPEGVLIFKWSEVQIPAEKVRRAIGQRPLFGHHSGKKMGTFWGCFMKFDESGVV